MFGKEHTRAVRTPQQLGEVFSATYDWKVFEDKQLKTPLLSTCVAL